MMKVNFVVLLALVFMIVMNGLANALPFNGQSTGEISDRFNAYFVPAGYVFSIWGLIYLGLIAYAVFQFSAKQQADPVLLSIAWVFVFSSVLNAFWLVAWHYDKFLLSVGLMLALLVSLVVIFMRLEAGWAAPTTAQFWFVKVPFSIYLGWISVATVANISQYLDGIGWSGWGIAPQIWTAIMIVVALGLGLAMSFRHANVAYGLVLIWAFLGIAAKHGDVALVANMARGASVLMGLGILPPLFFR